MKNILKEAVRNALVFLEHASFVSIKKSPSVLWYDNLALEKYSPVSPSCDTPLVAAQPDWKKVNKVRFSGVGVLSEGKVIICQPSNVETSHAECRKAIACTRNYRPLEYPGVHSVLLSLIFVRNNLYRWLKKRRFDRVPGNVALLGNYVYVSSNYYHFWTDVIADIWYVRKILPNSELPDYYLVPLSGSGLAWQWDILHLCGLRDEQIIPYSKYDTLSVDKLTIPVRDKGAVNLPSWLASAMHQMSGWTPRAEKGERLIFVSRADASRRRVVNETLIRERLVKEGFEVYTLEGLSFPEQQELFASASIICAPHGAALTNLVWCGPGAVVIDLLSERHLLPCFKELAEQNQVIYYPSVCQKVEGDDRGIDGDIIVSDQQVESILKVVADHSLPRTVPPRAHCQPPSDHGLQWQAEARDLCFGWSGARPEMGTEPPNESLPMERPTWPDGVEKGS